MVKSWENVVTKSVLRAANGTNLNAPCPKNPLSHQQMDVPFPLFSLPTELAPTMKVKKSENAGLKIGLKCCKWSSLNTPSIETLFVIQVGRIPISHFWPSSLLGNKNWPLKYKSGKLDNLGR